MKNEERIFELLAETLQRIDRYSEIIELHSKSIELQLTAISTLMEQAQKYRERSDQHSEAINTLGERTEVMHQTSLEQQKAYQAMTELLLHYNRVLTDKGML